MSTDVENFAGEVGVTKFDELPFGAYNDPITYVSLAHKERLASGIEFIAHLEHV